MVVGVLRLELLLPENHSLKGKRQVLKSLISRLHNRFNVSAAEIDNQDSWQLAELGVSCVTNDEKHADQVLASVIAFIRNERLDAEVLDVETKLIRA